MLESMNDHGQHQIGQGHRDEHRQSEKPDQPAGLFPGAGFLVKKVHGLPFVCNTRLVGGKSFCEWAEELFRRDGASFVAADIRRL